MKPDERPAPVPTRGAGEQADGCAHRDTCTTFAARADWSRWTCKRCPALAAGPSAVDVTKLARPTKPPPRGGPRVREGLPAEVESQYGRALSETVAAHEGLEAFVAELVPAARALIGALKARDLDTTPEEEAFGGRIVQQFKRVLMRQAAEGAALYGEGVPAPIVAHLKQATVEMLWRFVAHCRADLVAAGVEIAGLSHLGIVGRRFLLAPPPAPEVPATAAELALERAEGRLGDEALARALGRTTSALRVLRHRSKRPAAHRRRR